MKLKSMKLGDSKVVLAAKPKTIKGADKLKGKKYKLISDEGGQASRVGEVGTLSGVAVEDITTGKTVNNARLEFKSGTLTLSYSLLSKVSIKGKTVTIESGPGYRGTTVFEKV